MTQFAEEAQLVMAGNELKRVLVKVCLVHKELSGRILVTTASRPDQVLVSQDVSSVVIHPSSDKTVTYTRTSPDGMQVGTSVGRKYDVMPSCLSLTAQQSVSLLQLRNFSNHHG